MASGCDGDDSRPYNGPSLPVKKYPYLAPPLPPSPSLSASLMRQAVYGTARLGLHREFSEQMKAAQGGGTLPAWKTIASSMGSGALASIIGTPFDISLVRMQADSLKPLAGEEKGEGERDGGL